MIAPSLPPVRRKFGAVIREARERLGLRQCDVGKHCGVSANRVTQLERFTGSVTPAVVRKFAGALGLDVDACIDEFARANKPMRETERAKGVTVLGKVPGRYPGNYITNRRYGCHGCNGAAYVDVAGDEPMPADWGVSVWRGKYGRDEAAYYCPACDGARKGAGA